MNEEQQEGLHKLMEYYKEAFENGKAAEQKRFRKHIDEVSTRFDMKYSLIQALKEGI